MTTGEKIAALRRASGLNQEELAERLGISRQAVSKWEAGMAAPSTEKYRELSRIFGVSVDELLNPDTTQKQEERKIGEISGEPAEQDRHGFWRARGKHIAAAAAAAVALGWIVALQIQLGAIQAQLEQVRQLAQSRGDIITIPQSPAQESELTDWSAQILEYDRRTETVLLHAEAVPRSYGEGAGAQFCVRGAGYDAAFDAAFENGCFAAQMELPADVEGNLSLYLLMTQDGESRNIFVQELGNLAACFRLVCNAAVEHAVLSDTALRDVSASVEIQCAEPLYSLDSRSFQTVRAYPVRGTVSLYIDGEKIETQALDLSDPVSGDTEAAVNADDSEQVGGTTVYFVYFKNVSLDNRPEDFWVEAELTDNYGRAYTCRSKG